MGCVCVCVCVYSVSFGCAGSLLLGQLSLVVVSRLLITLTSPVVEHGLSAGGLTICGSGA